MFSKGIFFLEKRNMLKVKIKGHRITRENLPRSTDIVSVPLMLTLSKFVRLF